MATSDLQTRTHQSSGTHRNTAGGGKGGGSQTRRGDGRGTARPVPPLYLFPGHALVSPPRRIAPHHAHVPPCRFPNWPFPSLCGLHSPLAASQSTLSSVEAQPLGEPCPSPTFPATTPPPTPRSRRCSTLHPAPSFPGAGGTRLLRPLPANLHNPETPRQVKQHSPSAIRQAVKKTSFSRLIVQMFVPSVASHIKEEGNDLDFPLSDLHTNLWLLHVPCRGGAGPFYFSVIHPRVLLLLSQSGESEVVLGTEASPPSLPCPTLPSPACYVLFIFLDPV